jgi:stearoyl-CoA desaturase (delta-9 desaturase)
VTPAGDLAGARASALCVSTRIGRSKYAFLGVHLAALGFLLFGRVDAWGGALVWFTMQLAIHAGYHRCFAHRSFRTHPVIEVVFACVGSIAGQNGPLWWATMHRRHHRFADTEGDHHSPTRGLFYSHLGWLWVTGLEAADLRQHPDLARPHLLWVENHKLLIGGAYLALVGLLWGLPGIGSYWVIPVVACWHTTAATNSLAHSFGSRPFAPPGSACLATNNAIVAWLNLGEGWHNNHHAHPACCHHGFYRWYQVDITYVVIWLLARLGLAWDVRTRSTRGPE